jgi:hypothetical protein
MNKEGSGQNQVTSGSGAFIFDTSVPFFDLAYKHEIGPFENFYLAVMVGLPHTGYVLASSTRFPPLYTLFTQSLRPVY